MGLTRPRAHQLQDIDYKQTARALTDSNITLSGGTPVVIDGVTLLVNDRILVTGQTDGSQNGIYYVTTLGSGSNGTWSRSLDANATGEISAGTVIMVTEGTTYADTQWKLTTDDPITVGTTALTFARNGTAAYGVFAVAGQNSIVADAVGDTLTLVAGTNIALTTNASTDTLTITPSLTPALTTATFTNTTTDDSILVTTTENSSSAAPVITLKRNSASVADADYLGQLKFKGENDADQEVVYAKITAKIQDNTDGTEDGLIEFANRKAGSNNITARLRSDSLQLLNGTSLVVAGLTYPTSDGSNGQVLSTNGSGTLSFSSISGGASVSSDTTTNAERLIYVGSTTTGTLSAVTQDSGLTYNPSTGLLTSAGFSGSGASLTALNGSNISTGTVAAARVATLNQNTTGSAATLTTARAIQVSGAVTGTADFDGSAAINIVTTNTADPTITLTGAVTGSGTLTNLGDVSIATTNTADPTITLAGDLSGSATLTNLGSATLTATVGTLNQNTTGSAAKLTTPRAIALSGAVTGTANFDGSSGITIATTNTADPTITLAGDLSGSATLTNLGSATLTATIVANSVALGTDTTGNYVATGAVSGVGLSGSSSSEGGTFTVTSNATSANTASTIVARDGSGNFSAGTITATSTSAQYADLAEKYTTDQEYPIGTVMKVSTHDNYETDAAMLNSIAIGVISAEPAYLMNSDSEGQAIGLKGRVPVRVVGAVKKGEAVYCSDNGTASAEFTGCCLVGITLESNINTAEKLVECVLKI
jgi:hypothetical protein